MTTPTYKGPGQPAPSTGDGVSGWLGSFLGGAAAPAYKSAPPPAPPAPAPCPPCKPCPEATPAPMTQSERERACDLVPMSEPLVLGDGGDTVIPVGPGPITIVIQPHT